MQLSKEQKNELVNELKNNINKSSSVVVWNHDAITVNDFNNLRSYLKENKCETKVYKNKLSKLAFSQAGFKEFNDGFSGVSSIAFSYDENVNVSKLVYDHVKKLGKKEFLRAGLIEKEFVSQEKILEYATLPSKSELISMFLSVIQAPVRNFAYLTKQIAEKK